MPLQQFDERIPNQWTKPYAAASTPNAYTLDVSQTGGDYRIDTITITNTDTIDHNVAFAIDNNDAHMIFEVKVPAGAGTGGVAPVDVLALMPAGFHYLLGSTLNGGNLYSAIREAVGGTANVVVTYLGGMF